VVSSGRRRIDHQVRPRESRQRAVVAGGELRPPPDHRSPGAAKGRQRAIVAGGELRPPPDHRSPGAAKGEQAARHRSRW